MIIRPAAELARDELLALFNAGYSDYIVPMHMRPSDFDDHVQLNGIDLARSRVVMDDAPAAFALVGRRGDRAWIGGMGTHPQHRRRGLGEAALRAAIDAARDGGASLVQLEVIEGNDRAIALYEKLGFIRTRELVVAQIDPAAGAPAGRRAGEETVAIADREAQAWVAAHGSGDEPWQRADAVIERLREQEVGLRGLAVRDAGAVTAAAVLRDQEQITAVLQVGAETPAAAAELLRAATAGERPVRLVNVPDAEPAAVALEQLGARVVARQHEMRLNV